MSDENPFELKLGKGIISIVSDHDDYFRNETLAKLLNDLLTNDPKTFESNRKILDNFYFVFTGGTFQRIFNGAHSRSSLPLLKDSTKAWLKERTIQLPRFSLGGVSVLTFLLLKTKSKTIWSFQSPDSPHHLVAQNSILRLASNVNGVKRLVNTRTVEDWICNEHYKEDLPSESSDLLNNLKLVSGKSISVLPALDSIGKIEPPENYKPNETILLILVRHDFSEDLGDFLNDNEKKIFENFDKVLITRTVPLERIFESKPFYAKRKNQIIFCKPMGVGGLIEASMQILYKECDTVIFYDDLGEYEEKPEIPSNDVASGEIDDPFLDMFVTLQMISFNYQVILAACKINQDVLVKRTKNEADKWVLKLP